MNFSNLKPHSGTHSIQNAVLAVEWEPIQEDILALLRLEAKKTPASQYKEDEVRTVSFNISPQTSQQTVVPVLSGYNYTRVSTVGTVEYQVQITLTSLIFIVSSYTRWNTIVADFQSIAAAILPIVVQKSKISVVGLQYTDKFNWIGDKKDIELDKIFDKNSPFIPSHVFNCKSLWHAHHGSFEDVLEPVEGRRANNININCTEEFGNFAFTVLTSKRLMLGKADANPNVIDVLNKLHDHHKIEYSGLLTNEVVRLIGMSKS